MDFKRKKKVLIIDDELIYHEVVSRILISDNYEVYAECDGSRIINTVLITQPDIIILDWHIPGYENRTIIQDLKSTPGLQDIPIILSTSLMATIHHVEDALAEGAIDYIRKPFDQLELKIRLQTALNTNLNSTVDSKRKKLEQLLEVKDQLLSVLIHDIRNPIQSLLAATELLKSPEISGDNHEIVESISHKIKINLEFIENIFSWSKGSCNGMSLQKENVDLSSVLHEIIHYAKPLAEVKNIEINLESEISDEVHVDSKMMTFVLRNLVSNAIKFSYKEGKIDINMTRHKGGVSVIVKDQGRGITPSQMSRLFEVGYSTQGIEKEIGSGLGLYLSKEFIECNKGRISVESVPREYTIFTIDLPVLEEASMESIDELAIH